MEKIKNWIWTIIGMLILIIAMACMYNYYSNRLEISDQNLRASRSQIEVLTTKNNELLAMRDSYVLKEKELEEVLGITKEEVKELKKNLDSKIAYIAELESKIETGPIIIQKDSIVYVENTNIIESHFKYEDKWLSLVGMTKIDGDSGSTTIDNIFMDVPLTVGLSNDYQIFVKTANPYVNFSSLEGAVVDGQLLKPKKKRFSWGLHGGFGVMYDVIDKDVAVGPTISFGAHINF